MAVSILLYRFGVGFREVFCRTQIALVREINDTPELRQAILHRSATHGNVAVGRDAVYRLALSRIAILDVLCLVYHEHLPFLFLQFVDIRAYHTVCGEDDISILAVIILQVACRTVINARSQLWGEALHFRLPVVQQTCRHYHKSFLLVHCALFFHFQQQSDNLQGLTKTHVIGYNTAEAYLHVAIHP